MHNIVIADIMTRLPIIVTPNANLLECAKQMVRKRVGSLLIVDKEKLVGFISQKDILWALIKKSKEDLADIKAIDISPKKIATLNPNMTIQEAIKKIKKLKFERLPVIHNKELVGMVTAKDILSFHPELYPELEELVKIREETQKLKRIKSKEIKSIQDGVCEECGNQNLLYRFNGMLICDSCKNQV